MKIIVILVVLMTLVTGCKKGDEYEHYDLKDKNPYTYTIADKEGYPQIYALADITPNQYETKIVGLFYNVSKDDYILLDKYETTTDTGNLDNNSIFKFYEDKLYIAHTMNDQSFSIITFDREKMTRTSVKFTRENGDDLYIEAIQSIEKDEIQIYTTIFKNEHNVGAEFNCSLTDYTCVEKED